MGWRSGMVSIGLHAQTWQCTHFVGLKTTNCGGPIDVHGGIHCTIQLNATSGTGDKPTDTTGPKLQEDNLLRQPSGSAGLNQQPISKAHAIPQPCFFLCK
ncbi:hypothetical protein O181_001160 [Austropuccinia psidii MF-1]|uniref:Uncharacterized protein n=1 Tax=Austropuccinia psidii MF-1 TaxID=1389203 RepID=A0A9Q3BAG2_9BASI|nr:hypothetical protein [Austropuccinia psidii MF-1]